MSFLAEDEKLSKNTMKYGGKFKNVWRERNSVVT